MITSSLALILITQQGGAPAVPSVADLIQGIAKRYLDSESFAGSITRTQTVADVKQVYVTNIQAQRPNKLYLSQEWLQPTPGKTSRWTVISDGAQWRYDAPQSEKFVNAPPQFERTAVEETATGVKRVLKFNDFLIGARRSLGDPWNPYLQFTMQSAGEGNNTSLRAYINRMQKLSVVARKLKDGSDGWALKGMIQWGAKFAGDVKEIGLSEELDRIERFEIQVTKEFDIRKCQTVESVRIVPEGSNVPTDLNISTIWEGELKLNSDLNQALFKVN
jgi:hypothetical protein